MATTSMSASLGAQSKKEATPAASDHSKGDASRGKDIYIKNACYQCHGYEGQGGSPSGVRIAPDPLPWEAIAAYIRKPTGQMPPYTSKLLPDKDVEDIYAFLESRAKPADINKIPSFRK
jgi:mono/diheme cytochrome c family protein